MSKRPRPPAEPPLLDDARALVAGIEDLERLAARVAETNLPTGRAITRSGETLTEALGAHQRFVTALQAVSDRIGELRDRHNAAAERLANEAARVDARRLAYQGFEQRFAALALEARETDGLLAALPKPDSDADPIAHVAAMTSALGAIRSHLAKSAADAGALAADAAGAGFVDLRQQAEEVRDQLASMLRRVESAAPEA